MTKNIRLLSILEALVTDSTVSVKALASLYDVTPKSIQNDFQILKAYFGEKLIKKGERYQLLSEDVFSTLFKSNPHTVKRFLQLVSMVDAPFYDALVKENAEQFKALKLNTSSIYQIENSSYEHLSLENRKILDNLEFFISQRHYVNITYIHPNIDTFIYAHSIPLKILLLKENWYLAVLTTNNVDNNSIFKKLRINFIYKVEATKLEPKHFHVDHTEKVKAERFLKSIQSPFSDMDKRTYKVVLKVSLKVARYFKSKHYLKSQKFLQELENGDILLSYEISHDMEIIPLVQQWMPFIQVVEPLCLQEKIVKNVEKFMKGV